jgi:hypothetical protein
VLFGNTAAVATFPQNGIGTEFSELLIPSLKLWLNFSEKAWTWLFSFGMGSRHVILLAISKRKTQRARA